MSTTEFNQTKPTLKVVQGGDTTPTLQPAEVNLTKADKILLAAGAGSLVVAGGFAAAANHVIINKDSQTPQERKALVVKQTDQWLEGFKLNGQVHHVKVKTGDTPSGIAAELEPEAVSASFVTGQEIQNDIASHAPGDGYIQPGQEFDIADIPDGQVAPPKNLIAPVRQSPDK